ncbi:hypothetical protein, partial [Lactobacillus hamsteri]
MKNKKVGFVFLSFLTIVFLFCYSKKTYAKSYSDYQTKIVNNHKFNIYRFLTKSGPKSVMSNTKTLHYGNYQSKLMRKNHHQRYWYVLIDGHNAGWVNEKAFQRNKISVAKNVSLVYNPVYNFPVRDAINYVTDKHGTSVSANKVKASQLSVSSKDIGEHNIKYSYDKAHAYSTVVVRKDQNEGIVKPKIKAQPGKSTSTWKHHFKSSGNWGKSYAPETKSHVLISGGLKLRTVFYQPATLSQGNTLRGTVGPTPEGMTISNGRVYISMYLDPNLQHAKVVSYKLNKVPNKYDLQKLPWLPWNKFVSFAKYIKVSPLIKMGHGQSLSSTKKYLYVIANDHLLKNSFNSEEIIQIKKSNLQIKKIWTFRIWNISKKYSYYIHNAVFVNDHEFYAVFHNSTRHKFQYWRVVRHGNKWIPKEVGVTQGEFMKNNSPVQGFTYNTSNQQFYLAFNDYIFRIARNGRL